MIDIGNLMSGAGVMLGTSMAGAGALKMFMATSRSVMRIPSALERTAIAAERQAQVAEQNAELAKTLYDLREGQEQIRITMSTIAGNMQELPCALARPGTGLLDCEVK